MAKKIRLLNRLEARKKQEHREGLASQKKCSLCVETVLVYFPPTKKGGKDFFWKCPDCGAEVWPENLAIQSQIRANYGMSAKKKTGSHTRKKRKNKKPGNRFKPWYCKYGN